MTSRVSTGAFTPPSRTCRSHQRRLLGHLLLHRLVEHAQRELVVEHAVDPGARLGLVGVDACLLLPPRVYVGTHVLRDQVVGRYPVGDLAQVDALTVERLETGAQRADGLLD